MTENLKSEKRVKAGKKSKSKGGAFERKIALDLTKWTGVLFSRVPMSGGWNQTGDLTPKQPEDMVKWKFNCECKNQQSWNIQSLFGVRHAKDLPEGLKKFWNQTVEDANKVNRIPLLIFTKNYHPTFVMLKEQTYRNLRIHEKFFTHVVCGDLRIMLWNDLISVPYEEIVSNCDN